MSAENLSAEKIQALKAEISMLQRKNQTINKEEEKIDKVKRNLLMEKQQQHEILEECSDDGEKEEAVKKYYSSKEYEQFIIEASDPVISDDDIEEEEEYFKDPRDVALQDAYARIKMLENEIVKLRNTAQTDDTYILELERELETLSSPRRRIQFLENQVENVRHQYSNLSAQFRRKEESEREKLAAYETIKKNFLTHLMKMNSEKDELFAALEAKNKENEQLRKIISQYQTSKATLSTSQISGNLSTSNTQTTEESMDLSNPPPTPNNNDAIVANVSPKKLNASSPDLCF
uniref:Uncharacterized protein n=1 Tax=Panagrolaimus sp. PS1159 TaxID=55785 RepID=A0AC35GLZ8_9BILA